jgi:hypothetical protein
MATVSADDQARVRELLAALTDALARHLDAVERRSGESDPKVFAAYEHLRDAFMAYDDVIYDVYDEVLPVEVVEFADDEEYDDEEVETDGAAAGGSAAEEQIQTPD